MKENDKGNDIDQFYYFPDLDRGWAWVVLVASFGCFMLIGGTMYAVGIIHIAMLERYEEDISKTALAGALQSAVMSLGGPLSSTLIDRFSCRMALVTSGCLYVIGYLATAFAPNIEVCIFTCGIIAGCGGAVGYTAAMVVIGFNFRLKRNPAMGFAVSGIGAGMFVMAPVYEVAREFYGNSGFFIALAGLTANIIVFGTLCFPSKLELQTKRKRSQDMTRKTQKSRSCHCSALKFYVHVAFMKPVLCLSFGMFCYGLGIFLIFLHLPNYAVFKGSSSIEGSILISISGIMGMTGRILTGFAANHEKVDAIILWGGSVGVVSLATFLFPLFSYSFAGQVVYSALFGLYFGSCMVVIGSVNIKFVGIECMAAAIGLELCYCGIGAVIGPVLAGFFLLISSALTMATVWVSTPKDNELQRSDIDIEIMGKRRLFVSETQESVLSRSNSSNDEHKQHHIDKVTDVEETLLNDTEYSIYPKDSDILKPYHTCP